MRIFYILLVFIILLSPSRIAFSAACTTGSGSDFNCCQADASTSGTKLTLTNVSETTRKCSWPADTKFEFTIKKFGLLPLGGTEADIVYRGDSTLFNAGAFGAGATMGNFIAGANFPDGSYSALVPILGLSETVQSSTAPTITYDSSDRTCTNNSVTHLQQPASGGQDFMCTGESATAIDQDGDGATDFTLAVGTFGTDYGLGIGPEVCFLDEDGNGVVDAQRIFDSQLGTFTISKDSTYTISLSFNTSDGVIYSVFDDAGWGAESNPVACTAVDVGDLDVTITKE